MGEALRAIALLVLVGFAYFQGRSDGREHRAELALAESAAVIAERDLAQNKLLESERRMVELEESAAAAGTQTRTIIKTAKSLADVPVPPNVRDGLRKQMARTRGQAESN